MAEHQAAIEAGDEDSTADARTGEAHGAVGAEAAPFDRDELDQFDKEDRLAGTAIGKMLSLFFFYTVVAMSLVAWWTFQVSR